VQFRYWAIVFASLILIACGGGSDDPSATTPTASAGASPRADPPASPSSSSPTLPPNATGPLPSVRLERAFPALSFVRMTGLYQPRAGEGRWFVTEQRGRIYSFEDRQDVAQAQLFLDITDRVSTAGNEEGLLGLALAPDFTAANGGYVFVYYAAANPRRTVLSAFFAPAGGPADRNSERVILEVAQPFPNHKGGQIAFEPGGSALYVGLGDGGSGNDPMNNGQNRNVLSASSCASTCQASAPVSRIACRRTTPSPARAACGARSGPWACATRGASPGTCRPATSGSRTSVRTVSKR
jgi:glucose/arabinose dehydrogenase